jgi:hypothetical protein
MTRRDLERATGVSVSSASRPLMRNPRQLLMAGTACECCERQWSWEDSNQQAIMTRYSEWRTTFGYGSSARES